MFNKVLALTCCAHSLPSNPWPSLYSKLYDLVFKMIPLAAAKTMGMLIAPQDSRITLKHCWLFLQYLQQLLFHLYHHYTTLSLVHSMWQYLNKSKNSTFEINYHNNLPTVLTAAARHFSQVLEKPIKCSTPHDLMKKIHQMNYQGKGTLEKT